MIRSTEPAIDEVAFNADLALKRLMPRLEQVWQQAGVSTSDVIRVEFEERLNEHWRQLFRFLLDLYGHRYDFYYHLESILQTLVQAWATREASLKQLDRQRINQPDWFQSERIVGGALYVDLFSENLSKLRSCIPYLQELGLTYLHLMPLFAVRPGNNDGGYAISDYRAVDPRLGTIEDLQGLAADLRAAGICLVLDFVFNHTSDDHQWARAAQSGDREFQQYYYIFDDLEIPQQYERTLREIFPTVRKGNFTRHEGMGKYVWTTFNDFQWDLNYSNPSVFNAMLNEMLFIANTGVDILRLDAIAFIWKQMGTGCENLPQAHTLVRAYNLCARIAAPGLLFKSEAIVHPDEVVRYIDPLECQISYNPTLMALLWESLATRKTDLLRRSLSHRHRLPPQTAWVNYLRCHDDIGWTFDDADAAAIGINAYDHRQFLNAFYTGQFPESFAHGIPFQHNVQTGDMRISGTLASLAGLEQALAKNDVHLQELAIRRMQLLQGLTLSIGGIPLLYMGEEWGVLNDYDFANDPAKAGDSRWVHRPRMRWENLQDLDESTGTDLSLQRRVFRSLQKMIRLRKSLPALASQDMELIQPRNSHLLAFVRSHLGNRMIVVANFSEETQVMSGNVLRTSGFGRFFKDVLSDRTHGTSESLKIDPLQLMWLARE